MENERWFEWVAGMNQYFGLYWGVLSAWEHSPLETHNDGMVRVSFRLLGDAIGKGNDVREIIGWDIWCRVGYAYDITRASVCA